MPKILHRIPGKKTRDLHADLIAGVYNLSPGAKEIFRYCLNFKYGSDISNKKIVEDLHIVDRSFYRHLKELRSKGVMLYERHPAKKQSD